MYVFVNSNSYVYSYYITLKFWSESFKPKIRLTNFTLDIIFYHLLKIQFIHQFIIIILL